MLGKNTAQAFLMRKAKELLKPKPLVVGQNPTLRIRCPSAQYTLLQCTDHMAPGDISA